MSYSSATDMTPPTPLPPADLPPAPAPPGFWGAFPDPATERQYRLTHAADDRGTARLVLIVGVVAGTIFGLTDFQQPGGRAAMFATRAVAVLSTLALYLWLRRPRSLTATDRLLFAWGLSVAWWYALVQISRPAGYFGPTTATLCTIALTYTVVPLPLRRLTVLGLALLAGCLGVAVWLNPVPDPASLRALGVWLVAANVLGWAAARRLQTRSRLLFLAHAQQAELTAALEKTLAEVRTLRGLIRICAWCKHVNADGEWQQVERYVAANSHAEFTHGICPACLADQIKPAAAAPASRG